MAAAVLTLLSLIYLGGLAALLCVAYSRRHFNRYTAVKAAVSCGFLVIAATAYLLGGHTADAYFRGLLPCFVLCLAGDVLLGLANNHAGFFGRWFLLGVGAFTLAHAGFCVLFTLAMPGGPEVFALPGPIGNPGSEGPHWLIKQGAILVTEPEEILENLQFGLHWLPDAPENSFYSPDQQDVALPFPELLANVGDEVTPVDVVAERAGQPVPEVVTQLLELELAGWIAAVPGGYVRLRRACHVRRTNVFV